MSANPSTEQLTTSAIQKHGRVQIDSAHEDVPFSELLW
jgi:hypothetical protein